MSDSTTSWDNIVATQQQQQDQETSSTLEISSQPKKNPRGRPKVRREESVTLSHPAPPVQPESIARPSTISIGAELPEPEKILSTTELIEVVKNFSASAASPRNKKNLRVSMDTPGLPEQSDGTETDPERLTLLRMYKQYFKKPLVDKHQRKEKAWSDKHATSDIYREIKELDALCSEDDPAQMLSDLWVQGMVGVETLGPLAGLQTQNLSVVAEKTAQTDQFRGIMRELLIKYPYLRKLMGLGGFPEIKLLLITATSIRMVHDANCSAQPLFTEAPEDLQTAYDKL